MKAEKPATGILKQGEWGDSISYHVPCECTNPDDAHDVWVEADDHDVTVTIYTKSKSKWWEKTRWHQIWQLMTRGYIEMQTTTLLKGQQALNYAETLKQAARDVEKFRKETKNAKQG